MEPQRLNVLCLDGGGVRGVSSLLILKRLMVQLQLSTDSQTLPLPCEVFDLICGTSTGGLIALMLGRLRMSVDETIASYLDFSKTIFEEKSSPPPPSPPPRVGFWGRFQKQLTAPGSDASGDSTAKYDATKLEDWVKRVAEKIEGDSLAVMEDPLERTDRGCCHTFVVAVSQAYADAPPRLFRNYSTRTQRADTLQLWEAARATTAASPFFKPINVGMPPVKYIDGAFSGANNPSQLAAGEAEEVFPGRPIGCFLSLGTGVPDVVSVAGSLSSIAEACEKLLKSCEVVNHAVGRDFRKKTPEGQMNPYFRFSVDRGLGNIALDEWNQLQDLTGRTDAFLRYDDQEAKADNCVKVLKARAEEVKERSEEAMTLQ